MRGSTKKVTGLGRRLESNLSRLRSWKVELRMSRCCVCLNTPIKGSCDSVFGSNGNDGSRDRLQLSLVLQFRGVPSVCCVKLIESATETGSREDHKI